MVADHVRYLMKDDVVAACTGRRVVVGNDIAGGHAEPGAADVACGVPIDGDELDGALPVRAQRRHEPFKIEGHRGRTIRTIDRAVARARSQTAVLADSGGGVSMPGSPSRWSRRAQGRRAHGRECRCRPRSPRRIHRAAASAPAATRPADEAWRRRATRPYGPGVAQRREQLKLPVYLFAELVVKEVRRRHVEEAGNSFEVALRWIITSPGTEQIDVVRRDRRLLVLADPARHLLVGIALPAWSAHSFEQVRELAGEVRSRRLFRHTHPPDPHRHLATPSSRSTSGQPDRGTASTRRAETPLDSASPPLGLVAPSTRV